MRGCHMREIVDDIFTWSRLSEPHGYNFNGYFIRHPSGNLCIDPVEPDEETLQALASWGVRRILLSNRNHVRAANRIRARTGARTAIHPIDAAHARSQGAELDDELRPGETVGPLTVLGVPGKSLGEVAFYWPERAILIVGDCVIGDPAGRCRLLSDKVVDEPPRLRKSVGGLLALDFDILLVGDGESILQDAKARLQELADTF